VNISIDQQHTDNFLSLNVMKFIARHMGK
jgi:hypothetical protein